jgi:hypothetical protein
VNTPNTGAVPATYGGVERANLLLRSLHEQPQASAEYNPSGQQGYQQGQVIMHSISRSIVSVSHALLAGSMCFTYPYRE